MHLSAAEQDGVRRDGTFTHVPQSPASAPVSGTQVRFTADALRAATAPPAEAAVDP
ncbi:hypothetical protein GCM10010293_55700 [Streptomyces griseoflavus]|nr:hypothetical protein GCM10010293_55700 [Streptomyces griseoflavus]